jgi:hypothetical protein
VRSLLFVENAQIGTLNKKLCDVLCKPSNGKMTIFENA